jgi:arylsulfatase A-like enzyme
MMGHKHGPQSADVEEMLAQFDRFLGSFLALLEKRGIADKTDIIISADHGMHETGELFELREALSERGFKLKPGNPRDHDYTLSVTNRGVASSQIYVRRNGTFTPLTHPEELRTLPTTDGNTGDLIETLQSLPGTELIVARAGDRSALVIDREGREARIDCTEINATDYCRYVPRERDRDPLDFSTDPKAAKLFDGKPHSATAWRTATAESRYPDAVIGFGTLFEDGRGGDLFVIAGGRYGFRKVKAGTHGGAGPDDMHVPLLIAGPDVPHGTYGIAQSTDLYPLVLSWFGIPVLPGTHDGRNPFQPPPPEDPKATVLAALDQLFVGQPSLINRIDIQNFVHLQVLPLLKGQESKALESLAQHEATRRSRLLTGLRDRLHELTLRQDDKKSERPVDHRYLDDHIAIIRRMIQDTDEGRRRMEEITSILGGCWRSTMQCSGGRTS